ncbi:putative transcription factor GRF family [Helianthus annuus]|nr:putative transcription factor GRF family [Helianthus annuus]
MVLCNCGQDAIIVTSWTDLNPGRRFCSCPTMVMYTITDFNSLGLKKFDPFVFLCRIPTVEDFIGWVDPPMCSRAVAIILGLLRHRNQVDVELAKMREKNRLKNKIITVLLIVLGFVFWMYVKA